MSRSISGLVGRARGLVAVDRGGPTAEKLQRLLRARAALDDDLAIREPKTLRYRLLHTAGRLAFHARRAILRRPRSWPWADALAAAFTRLAALPPPAH
jgi:hypothetical protein